MASSEPAAPLLVYSRSRTPRLPANKLTLWIRRSDSAVGIRRGFAICLEACWTQRFGAASAKHANQMASGIHIADKGSFVPAAPNLGSTVLLPLKIFAA